MYLRRSLPLQAMLLLMFCFAEFASQGQSDFDEFVSQIKEYESPYLWGEGTGSTERRADDEALADLISKISVLVTSSFENEVNETKTKNSSGEMSDFQQNVRGLISTYSQATLNNTERISLSPEPNARVLRYIKREDVNRVFEERKEKVYDYVSVAEKHEENVRLADALRYYNWALALLRSHPDSKTIRSDRANGSAYMQAYISERVSGILEDIQFVFSEIRDDERQREVILHVFFRGKPVVNLDYRFWYGRDWSRPYEVKDGRTMVDFFGENATSVDKTNVRVEYAYIDQLFGDKELEEIFRMIEPATFSKATSEVRFEHGGTLKKVSPLLGSTPATDYAVQHELTSVDPTSYKVVVDEVVEATRKKNTKGLEAKFTSEGYTIYEKLLLYGNARKIDDEKFKVYVNNNGFLTRGLYMSFDFENGRKSFVEEVVFHFNSEGIISTIAFGLGENATADIYGHPSWSQEEKLVLVDFLEQYKTAFALKRLDYLQSVFDDNAVIITGTVLKRKQEIDGKPIENRFASNQIVRYNRFTKKEYIQRLEHVFRSKDYINIAFEDNTLRKSNLNPNIFGVQIKQNYTSNNYSDQGYLFLIIDFTNRDEPTIHVRTWQPQKDEDGRVIGLEDF